MTSHTAPGPDDRPDPLAYIVAFLRDLGLHVEPGLTTPSPATPAVTLIDGTICYDAAAVAPGDLLHEAGHLAVLTPEDRARASGRLGRGGGEELAAIAWSWAAGVALGLAPEVVFHPRFGPDGDALRASFAAGQHSGAPLLAWYGLTDLARYPEMIGWLRG